MENKDQAKWYIIHTNSGYEKIVEDSLKRMIENNNLQDYIFDVKIPMEEEVVEKNGKKKVVERKMFSCYVSLKEIYTNHIWFMVTQTRGVTGFVGPTGHPLPISDEEVRVNGLEDSVDLENFDIKVGDNVHVISGALKDFAGEVEEINARTQKLKVRVSMFGRPTSVELDFTQVEKLNLAN